MSLWLWLTACSGGDPQDPEGARSAPATESRAAAHVAVEDAFARAVPEGTPMSAVFFTLRNAGAATAVVGATTPASRVAELHSHVEANGVMRMRQVEQLDLPERGQLQLRPGGDHVMLIGLQKPLVVGEAVQLTLQLADGSELAVSAPVRAPTPPRRAPAAAGEADGDRD